MPKPHRLPLASAILLALSVISTSVADARDWQPVKPGRGDYEQCAVSRRRSTIECRSVNQVLQAAKAECAKHYLKQRNGVTFEGIYQDGWVQPCKQIDEAIAAERARITEELRAIADPNREIEQEAERKRDQQDAEDARSRAVIQRALEEGNEPARGR